MVWFQKIFKTEPIKSKYHLNQNRYNNNKKQVPLVVVKKANKVVDKIQRDKKKIKNPLKKYMMNNFGRRKECPKMKCLTRINLSVLI